MAVVIPKELLSVLRMSGEKEVHKPKSKIFAQGDEASHFFIITKGRVRVYTVSANGKERTIEVLEEGRIFGDSSFLADKKREVTIEAVIDSEVICYRAEELIEMCTQSEQLMRLIFQHMADTCNYLTRQIVQSSQYNSIQKVADFLLRESETRGQDALPYTHEEIAASIALNRVTVSRIVSKFKSEGFVEVKYGNIEICDRNALERLLTEN